MRVCFPERQAAGYSCLSHLPLHCQNRDCDIPHSPYIEMDSPSESNNPTRGRGRGRSRGGLGKYLRARGRRGGGRPAEFKTRLRLEGDAPVELDEEEALELQAKYSRRHLGTNADRYVEPEPELDSDGTYWLLVVIELL